MFDLNEAISQWRQALAAQPGIQATDLEELEDHLREGVADLMASGLNEEEAFLVASRRLGKPEELNGEFIIADPTARRNFRLRWMVVGALALVFLWLASAVLTTMGAGTMNLVGGGGMVHSPLGAGLFNGVFRLLLLVLGLVLIWRLLATDGSSRRLRRMSGGGIILTALALAFLVLAARVMPTLMLARTFPHDGFLQWSVGQAYVNMGLWLFLPALLLVGLWKLVKS